MAFNFNLGGFIVITDFDCTMTDFVLGGLMLYFFYRTWMLQTKKYLLRFWVMGMYFSLALSSIAAGTSHGFYTTYDLLNWEEGYAQYWHCALTFMGISSVLTYLIGYSLIVLTIHRHRKTILCQNLTWITHHYFISAIHVGLFIQFSVFTFYVTMFNDAFISGALNYALSGLFLSISVLGFWIIVERCQSFELISSVVVLFAGIFVQIQQISIHPHYFDHNATFHTIQMVGFALLFFGLKKVMKNESLTSPRTIEDLQRDVQHNMNGLYLIFKSSTKNHRSFLSTTFNYFNEVLEDSIVNL